MHIYVRARLSLYRTYRTVVGYKDLLRLAEYRSFDEIRSEIVGALLSPTQQLARTLQYPQNSAVKVLQHVAGAKGDQTEGNKDLPLAQSPS